MSRLSAHPSDLPYIGDRVILLTCTERRRDELLAQGLPARYTVTEADAAKLDRQVNFDAAKLTERVGLWLESIRNESAMDGTICTIWIPSGALAVAAAIRQSAAGDLLEIHGTDGLKRLAAYAKPWPDTEGQIFAVCSIRNGGTELLPHWLDHYWKLGVDRILVGVFDDVSPEARKEISRLAETWPFTCFSQSWGEHHEITHEEQRRTACRMAGALPGTWIIHSDLDELHEFPAPPRKIVAAARMCGINAVCGHFIDRVTNDGTLARIRPAPSLSEQFPVRCKLTERILKAWTQKIMMAQFRVACGAGHHVASNICAPRVPIGKPEQYVVHHFKWHAELTQRLEWAIARPNANFIWRTESVRLLKWLKGNGGKINLSDPALGLDLRKAA